MSLRLRGSVLAGAAVGAALLAAAPAATAKVEAVPTSAEPGRILCAPLALSGARTSSTCGATISADGNAVAPPGAPAAVREAIEAADSIDHQPYVWGGGHVGWRSSGYDCSGAVGYALHAAGLLDRTMVSGELADWGDEGAGRWITVYADAEHVYMVIAGLRFDTRDNPTGTGPRWHFDIPRQARSFSARHPAGL